MLRTTNRIVFDHAYALRRMRALFTLPLSDRRFWTTQILIIGVVAASTSAEHLLPNSFISRVPDNSWVLLLFVPAVYAGVNFGLLGSLGSILSGTVVLGVAELIIPHRAIEVWPLLSTFVILLISAIVFGIGFEEKKMSTMKLMSAELSTKSEENFRLAFDGNMAPMVVADLDSHVLRVNKAFCDLLGCTEDELLGLNLFSFTHPEDRKISEIMNRRPNDGNYDRVQYSKRYIHKDGHIIFAEVSRSFVSNDAGEPTMMIGSVRDVTTEHALASKLSYQANHDQLTGLPNRVLFQDRLAHAFEQAMRDGSSGALLMLDLDDFKGVNDTLGHEVGDQLLVVAARRLEKVARSTDTLCRFGGDEFLYLAEGLKDTSEAIEIAQRMGEVFSDDFLIDGNPMKQSVSIGVVFWDAKEGKSWSDIFRAADTAMYRAKGSGKNCYKLFTTEMTEDAASTFKLTQDLSRALSKGEISMRYQQIMDISTSQIVGYEALMRWNHPDLGWVSPSVFIPLAEKNNLIAELGVFALREAISEATNWYPMGVGTNLPYVAVNLSAAQFHDANIVSSIEEILKDSGLEPERLVIEITEGVALTNINFAVEVVNHLKRVGISVSLDDFGTGYSSLSYLARLRPNCIKIDRSFVSGSEKTFDSDCLLEAIISLCHVLNMTVLAEGIETPAQLAVLQHLGCELGQGYLFSAAIPASELPYRLGQDKVVPIT